MSVIPILARLPRAVQSPRCPHCEKQIDLLEPEDVNELGLPWIKRRELNKSGELRPWAIVRGGKVWLYLKRDVDNYLRGNTISRARKELRLRTGMEADEIAKIPDEVVLEIQKQQDLVLRRALRRLEETENDTTE